VATAVVRFHAAAITDRGRKRPSNEDAFGYSVEDGVYVVCDGMGGAAAGEVASSLAVDEVLRVFHERNGSAVLPKDAREAVGIANQAIYSRARRNHQLSGMGTTLVAALIRSQHIWVLNVGDSRCYRLRGGRLEQLTLDHSLVEEQVRLGRMTRAQAARSPMRNMITRALGTQSKVTPDCFDFEAQPGDLLLLCSDGLTREVPDRTIEFLVSSDSPLEERCSRLVEAAKKAGGHDNITCLLVQAH
jgi:PPM family protein phosphatase